MTIPEQIDAIKNEFAEYYRSPETLERAMDVWQADCRVNSSGVFADYEEEIVARSGRAKASIGICRVRDGVFVHCCSLFHGMGGFGYSPSVWDSEPHSSEEDARRAAMEELLARISRTPKETAASAVELSAIRAQLEARLRQRSLF